MTHTFKFLHKRSLLSFFLRCNDHLGLFSLSLFLFISAYSTFYIVGLVLSMQIPFVGFQPIRTSEHMAAAGKTGLPPFFINCCSFTLIKKQHSQLKSIKPWGQSFTSHPISSSTSWPCVREQSKWANGPFAFAGVFALLQAYAFLQYLKDRLTRQEFQTLFFLGVSMAAGAVFLTVIYLTYTGECKRTTAGFNLNNLKSLNKNRILN